VQLATTLEREKGEGSTGGGRGCFVNLEGIEVERPKKGAHCRTYNSKVKEERSSEGERKKGREHSIPATGFSEGKTIGYYPPKGRNGGKGMGKGRGGGRLFWGP